MNEKPETTPETVMVAREALRASMEYPSYASTPPRIPRRITDRRARRSRLASQRIVQPWSHRYAAENEKHPLDGTMAASAVARLAPIQGEIHIVVTLGSSEVGFHLP